MNVKKLDNLLEAVAYAAFNAGRAKGKDEGPGGTGLAPTFSTWWKQIMDESDKLLLERANADIHRN